MGCMKRFVAVINCGGGSGEKDGKCWRHSETQVGVECTVTQRRGYSGGNGDRLSLAVIFQWPSSRVCNVCMYVLL